MSDHGYERDRPRHGPDPGQAAGQAAAYPGGAATYPGRGDRPDDGAWGATYPGEGATYSGQGAAHPGHGMAGHGPVPRGHSSPKGFVGSLFDFEFRSFVTPTIVKVVYVLVMIVLGLAVLGFAGFAFTVNLVFGIIALFILCPLYFFVYLALWRIGLEFFIAIFRIADDLSVIRSRGDLG